MDGDEGGRVASPAEKANLFRPVIILAIMSALLLVGGISLAIVRFDSVSLDREQTIVSNGILQRIDEIALLVVPQVVWDDAIAHLDNSFDKDWAEKNLSTFMSDVNGFSAVFVLDSADRPIYASQHSVSVPTDKFNIFASPLAPLINDVRAAERARPPLVANIEGTTMIAAPISASGISVIAGEPKILTATLVQPDFGQSLPLGPRAPIVITSMAIDRTFLNKMADRYLLKGLHVHAADSSAEQNQAHTTLRDRSGKIVATLDWLPRRPGVSLLKQLVFPITGLLALLAAFAIRLVRRGTRAANELIVSEARATHLAYHDSLTGLPNRALLFDRLRQALYMMRRSNSRLAVHSVDLDRFKEVNDSLGHHAGDELIRTAATRLMETCRSSDTVARLGGDEFVVIQTDADATKASRLATRIIEVLSMPVDLAESQVVIGCSVGTTLVTNADMEAAELLRQSDMALYKAKAAGRGQVAFFEIEMDAALKMRRELEADLRTALDEGGLFMAYQPQVDKHNKMTGVEALIRWDHPERGVISPAVFVPLAEECGLITELGVFALRRVFKDARKWSDLRVAINVSPIQLRSPLFTGVVERLVRELRVETGRFEIEITETALLGDDSVTMTTLRKLKKLGFTIALDDFGTGYSSLSHLQKFPVNKIKIDRSFVSNLGVDAESEAVVEAIVKLARALNLEVIAEGVETSDQRSRLTSVGCSEVQGFLYSKAISASEVDAMMGSTSAYMTRPLVALN